MSDAVTISLRTQWQLTLGWFWCPRCAIEHTWLAEGHHRHRTMALRPFAG